MVTDKSASVKLKAAGIAAVKAKATGNAKMSPPAKPTTPLRGHNPYQNSPTKGANDNKKNHILQIFISYKTAFLAESIAVALINVHVTAPS